MKVFHCSLSYIFPSELTRVARAPTQYDVTFLVIVRRDMDAGTFEDMKRFLQSFIARNFLVGTDSTRIALITYDDNANIEFYLDTYNTLEQVESAISRIQRGDTSFTNIAAALRETRNIYVTGRGDRPSVPNIVYLIVWGSSSQYSVTEIQREGDYLRNRSILVLGLGISSNVDRTFRNQLSAGSAPGFFYISPSFSSINSTDIWQMTLLSVYGESSLGTPSGDSPFSQMLCHHWIK